MKKYYLIQFATKPEVLERYGDLLTPYARDVIRSIVSMTKNKLKEEFEKISKDKIEAFYKSSVKAWVYVDEYSHNRWLVIPWRYKKHAHYLITQKLLDKLEQEGAVWMER